MTDEDFSRILKIAMQYYEPGYFGHEHKYRYMCWAIDYANHIRALSLNQSIKAKQKIMKLIYPYASLRQHLKLQLDKMPEYEDYMSFWQQYIIN